MGIDVRQTANPLAAAYGCGSAISRVPTGAEQRWEGVEPVEPPPEVEDACAICLDQLCDPTMLACGHVFCRSCAFQALAHAARHRTLSDDGPRDGASGHCPVCRRAVLVRVTGPEDLPLSEADTQRLERRYSRAQLAERRQQCREALESWAAVTASGPARTTPETAGSSVIGRSPRRAVAAAAAAQEPVPLPPGWRRLVDFSSHCVYYYNPATRRTQYQPPSALRVPAGAQQHAPVLPRAVPAATTVVATVRICGRRVAPPVSKAERISNLPPSSRAQVTCRTIDTHAAAPYMLQGWWRMLTGFGKVSVCCCLALLVLALLLAGWLRLGPRARCHHAGWPTDAHASEGQAAGAGGQLAGGNPYRCECDEGYGGPTCQLSRCGRPCMPHACLPRGHAAVLARSLSARPWQRVGLWGAWAPSAERHVVRVRPWVLREVVHRRRRCGEEALERAGSDPGAGPARQHRVVDRWALTD
jgi:hypothetical protein